MSYRISWLRCFFLLAWLLVSATVSPNLALAQASASPTGQEANSSQPEIEATSPLAAEAKVKLDEAAKQLADVQGQLNMRRDDDAALLELKTTSDRLISDNTSMQDGLRKNLDDISARLTDLGEPPPEGAPQEAEIVQAERARLDAQKTEINAVLSEIAALNSSITSVSNQISDIRRSLFAETLLRQTEVSPSLLMTAGTSFAVEMRSVGNLFSQWIGDVWQNKRTHLLAALALSALAALLFLFGSYRLFGKRLNRDRVVGEPSYLMRLSMAFWSTLIQAVSVILFIVTSITFLRSFGLMNDRVEPIIVTSLSAIGFVYVVSRLTYAIFTPLKPNWRLLNVSNKGAHFLSWAIFLMAVINASDYVFDVISDVLSSSLVLTVAKGIVAAVLMALVLLAISFSRPLIGEGQTAETGDKPLPRWLAIGIRIAAALLIIACLAGFIGLARFIATQIVATGAVLALMYIGFLSGKAISKQGHFAGTIPGNYLRERYNLGDVALDQIGLLFGFMVYAVAVLYGVPLILFSWGFQPGDIQAGLVKLFTGFTIGTFSISLVSILTGITIFAIGYMLTRWFQRWLDSNILVRSQVDAGVRNSVRTGIGYVGIVLATLFGITSSGLDLSNLALVVSALSVGIGFGLQNIVQNFVSGVILLVERPFKVGDVVVTGTTEGTVKRLSVRATEIETARGLTMIVPNSEFINSPVGNWTHRNRIQRFEIPVAVDYDSDPDKVIEILIELIRAEPAVLRNPEPIVEFVAFGDFTLNFELRFFVADLTTGLKTRNAIRTSILKRFKEEGIKFPFPTSELNIHVANRQTTDVLKAAGVVEAKDEIHRADAEQKFEPPSDKQ